MILDMFSRQAKREKWTKEEIDEVLTEARSGNYDHLIATIYAHCETPYNNEDEEECYYCGGDGEIEGEYGLYEVCPDCDGYGYY